MNLIAHEYSVTYGFGDGRCVDCGADRNVIYCHRQLTNHCDSCLRADFCYNRKNCANCSYRVDCRILDDYSDFWELQEAENERARNMVVHYSS
jgi:hypothetical protein